MAYFETTPIGRFLNRLTFDVEQLDISLSVAMTVLLISLGWFLTGIILQVSILPLVMCILLPVTIVYWILLLYYRKSAVDLQRLDAVSRSPVQARLAESEFLVIFHSYQVLFILHPNKNAFYFLNHLYLSY